MTEPDGRAASTGVSYERSEAPTRPPVLIGCGILLGLLVVLIAGGACAVVFLESGADSGKVVLRDARSYAPGSVEFVGDHNFFVVRTRDGDFVALDDLDAANRANQARRCRVQVIPEADPDLAEILDKYQARVSPAAAGMAVVFRESCNGALYDAAGVRLDVDGQRNLDRFGVGRTGDGRLEVSTGERICTRRERDDPLVRVDCP